MLLHDVTAAAGGFVVCGVEGEDSARPSFTRARVVVGAFGTDGSPRGTLHLPGRACRLFREPAGPMVLAGEGGMGLAAGLRLDQLSDDLRVLESTTVLDRIAFTFTVEAVRLGDSLVALSLPFAAQALHTVGPERRSSLDVFLPNGAPVALRSDGERVYLVSWIDHPTRPARSLRIDAFEPRLSGS